MKPQAKRVLKNIGWNSFERFLRMLTGLFIGLWMARYLGPTEFGNFSYVVSWLGLFNAIAWLGVGEIAVRDMVRDRCSENHILGSAFLIRLVGSLLSIGLAVGVAQWIGRFDREQMLLLAILSIGVPFAECVGGIHMWFVSHTDIKPVFFSKCASILFSATLKGGVILTQGGLAMLMVATASESILFGLGLVIAYIFAGQRFTQWRFDLTHAWSMFLIGLPFVLSGITTSINARVDQLVLGNLSGMDSVGVYSAAIRFSEIWWSFAPIFALTLAPIYIYSVGSEREIRENVSRIVAGMGSLSLIPCLLMSVTGADLIRSILGEQYRASTGVLVVHIWMAVVVFIEAPINQYLVATDRQSYLAAKSLVSLLLNAIIAVILVPRHGPTGAAIAALSAQLIPFLLLPAVYKTARDLYGIYLGALIRVGELIRSLFLKSRAQ